MKALVTGASGFLGTHLCRELEKRGVETTRLNSKNCDLTRDDSLLKFNDVKYDRIFHLAAWTQAGDFCLHHKGDQWIINQKINTNVLSFWKEHQPQAKMVAIGTSCCYEPGKPHIEENFLTANPIESLYTYAMTKRMLYVGLLSLKEQFGLKHLFVVPSTLYGPDYHLDGRQMHFIFDLIRKICEAKYLGKRVVLWGDGNQKRELIHVSDFITALLALDEKYDNEIVNIGGGKEYTIREFAGMLCSIIGYDPAEIEYDTGRYVGAKEKFLDTSKLKRLLPDFSVKDIREGLEETVKWYIASAGNLKR
ncbi:MAG: NAD-dependent epimerase/dehydratase family protein [Candidatus Dadabacteria bacterium]|nr:MAG: NAD-dependent epimerase/dehydratase family protein [Candidatus Dadabacteria bacterium]